MTFRYLTTAICMLFFVAIQAQSDQKYLGQKPPGKTPEKFAPGLISLPLEYEFGSTFSRDGEEFFYSVSVNGRGETKYMRLLNGKWTEPEVILAHEAFGYNDPMLSVDEDKLYFISTQTETDNPGDYDIWYVERAGESWSSPINAGPMINTEKSNEYYISFTESGAMYFASNKAAPSDRGNDFDIYKSEFKNGKFQKARKMPFNSEYYEGDVFVAPDESYVIFSGENPAGLGRGDLYITFQNNGEWTNPVNMGEPINDLGHQFCPFVTYDGKYLFFSSNRDIYWVDAAIIENYRAK
ncbi:MAG: hypothetical protein R8G66_27285 [Cytophagales bacterium]|nr:hypothetical protein [Cytophagales bacterium]